MKILCFGSRALSRLSSFCGICVPSGRFAACGSALKRRAAAGLAGLSVLAVCAAELPAQTTIPVTGGQITVYGGRDRFGAALPQQNQKIDRRLLSVVEGIRTRGVPVTPPTQQSHPVQIVRVDVQGRIRVYVKLLEWSDANLAALETVGAFKIDVANQSLMTVLGSIPAGQIEAVADLEFVEKVTPPRWGFSNAGSQNTEGDAIHMANLVRTNLGLNGTGVKIGIISDGFNGLATAQGTSDLPASVTTFGTSEGSEGVAMAEIIHDIAPNAQLAIGAGITDLEFIQRVTDLKDTFGADIIVDDILFPLEPYFEDGPVAQAYQMALDAGITMISAAGNQAQFHYQKLFDGSGTPYVVEVGGQEYSFPRHKFNTPSFPDQPEILRFRIPHLEYVLLVLQWTNEFGSSTDDYDICLGSGLAVDPLVWCTGIIQNGTEGHDEPLDAEIYYCEPPDGTPPDGYCFVNLQIVRFAGVDQTVEFFMLGRDPADILDPGEIIPGDAIVGHAALPGVISTAAINANDPGNDDIAPYSSRGPSTIRFPAQVVRATPSITGIDNVTVSNAWGGPVPFPGTSAAAPHIAGIAALMLQANPALTPSEVKATLQSTATDRGSAGFDNTFGAGLANAEAAVNSVAIPPQPPTADSVTPSSGSGPGTTFSYAMSDPNGVADLSWAQIVVNESLLAANSCYMHYVPQGHRLYLQNDAGSGWLGPLAVGSPGVLQNAKCQVDVGNSAVSTAGTTLTLHLDIEFPQAGAKNHWMRVTDLAAHNTGWALLGNWTATN